MKEHIKKIKDKVERIGIIKLLIILIVVIAIFQAGMFVGYYKANFYRNTGINYYKQFNGKHGFNCDPFRKDVGGFVGFMQDANITGGHGAVGKIVSINLPNIVIASPDNIEKTINISNDTLIRQFKDTIASKDLKVGEYVVVLGGDDNGVVNAKLIRLLPPPPEDTASSTLPINENN